MYNMHNYSYMGRSATITFSGLFVKPLRWYMVSMFASSCVVDRMFESGAVKLIFAAYLLSTQEEKQTLNGSE